MVLKAPERGRNIKNLNKYEKKLKNKKTLKINNLKGTERDPAFRDIQEITVKIYLYPLMVEMRGRSFIH